MTTATVVALVTLTPTPATADPAVPGDAAQQLSELNRQAEVLTERWHYVRDQLNARRADLERARADASAAQAATFAGGRYDANPEAELIARADAAKLEAAITALPPQFRDTLVLRDVQGLDYREIAAVTEVPVGTVMSRLARARQRLIEAIAADDR